MIGLMGHMQCVGWQQIYDGGAEPYEDAGHDLCATQGPGRDQGTQLGHH